MTELSLRSSSSGLEVDDVDETSTTASVDPRLHVPARRARTCTLQLPVPPTHEPHGHAPRPRRTGRKPAHAQAAAGGGAATCQLRARRAWPRGSGRACCCSVQGAAAGGAQAHRAPARPPAPARRPRATLHHGQGQPTRHTPLRSVALAAHARAQPAPVPKPRDARSTPETRPVGGVCRTARASRCACRPHGHARRAHP